MRTTAIDFVRQLIEQTLLEEHLKNDKYIGGKDQFQLFSFYENLQQQDEVDRYVERYRDLTEQQNRTGLIANGVIVAPENPQVININSSYISPLTWTMVIRCTLANRDSVIETLDNLSKQLRGRKFDIAELNTGELFKVGTPFQNDGAPAFKHGDFVGVISQLTNFQTYMTNLHNTYTGLNATTLETIWFDNKENYFYFENSGKIMVGKYDGNSTYEYGGDYRDKIIYPPEHTSFTKYKLSMSFDTIRVDEPRTLNANGCCDISIGGSATLVSKGVALGNDISKVVIAKDRVEAQTIINLYGNNKCPLEPLEIPSGLGISNEISQLASHNFLQARHNDGINAQINYSFVLDKDIALLNQLYKYARYGIVKTDEYGVSPNMVFEISEFSCSWGEYDVNTFYAKITDHIDIENTESDAMSISFQVDVQRY